MTNAIQLSVKADDGRIFVVGGDDPDHFKAQLLALYGDQEKAREAYNAAVDLLQPVSAGGFGRAQANVQAGFPQAAPPTPPQASAPQGEAPIGENGKPKRWVPPGVSKKTGRPYQGFWAEDRDRF